MAQKQKGVADAVIKAKLHTPYQNLIQQHIQQELKNKELPIVCIFFQQPV
jgi:hypothetical protein